MRDFRLYMAIGGMPQAVEAYIQKKTFQEIDRVKQEIIDLYKDDFSKIDPSGRIAEIYDSIPAQLSMNNNRFRLSKAINKRVTTKDESLFYDLLQSKTVLPCYNVKNPEVSLSLSKNLSEFKLYCCDTGLFTTMLFRSNIKSVEDIYYKLLSDKLDSNLGYLYENAIAQIIYSLHRNLYYSTWKENGNTHPYEVDFLISEGSKIIPIEVKSSAINNHTSITKFSKKYSSWISRRILFSQQDLGHVDMLELKPIYLAPMILSDIK